LEDWLLLVSQRRSGLSFWRAAIGSSARARADPAHDGIADGGYGRRLLWRRFVGLMIVRTMPAVLVDLLKPFDLRDRIRQPSGLNYSSLPGI
jgi:hypothetical protein